MTVQLQQRKASVIAIVILIVGLTWAVFGQCVTFDFVNYDDQNYVYANPNITSGLTMSNIGWAFTHVHSENWHPLTTVSHMLDCQLYGVRPGAHHLTNVLLHTAASILVFGVLLQLTAATWRSGFVAALFAIHPLHVESVAWVSERKDVLSAVFCMLTIGAYVRYARAPSRKGYALVLVLFSLGLLSKPMLITLPAVLLLLDWWPLNRSRISAKPKGSGTGAEAKKRRSTFGLFLEKWPLVLLSVGSGVATLLAQRAALGWIADLPIEWRLKNALVSVFVYIGQMICPINLVPFYPHPQNAISNLSVVTSAVALAGISLVAVRLRRTRPYLFTGWFWYLAMLAPVIGIVQVGWQAHADRYSYLPQIGLYIAVTWGVCEMFGSWKHRDILLGSVAAIIVVGLSWSAYGQTQWWRNSETLWTHALAVNPKNDVAENNLGIIDLARGRIDDATSRFERAIKQRPENAAAHENLGNAYLQKRQLGAAAAEYEKFIELEPNNTARRNVLGGLLIQLGRTREAVQQWEQTLRRDPRNGNAMNNIAWILATHPQSSFRDGSRAVLLAEDAARLPGGRNPLVLRTLSAAYAESGRFDEATKTAQDAAELAAAQQQPGLAEELLADVQLYQQQQPIRDPALDGKSQP